MSSEAVFSRGQRQNDLGRRNGTANVCANILANESNVRPVVITHPNPPVPSDSLTNASLIVLLNSDTVQL